MFPSPPILDLGRSKIKFKVKEVSDGGYKERRRKTKRVRNLTTKIRRFLSCVQDPCHVALRIDSLWVVPLFSFS